MKNWYVVHTQTGIEEKVKTSLEKKISAEGLQDLITSVIIPTEQVSEVRAGKKKITQRKFFPGYLLVEMDLSEQTYLFVKNSPGVTGFIGLGKKPVALPKEEVDSILKRTKETAAKPSPKIVFDKGEQVRVNEGPFLNFNGVVEEVYPEKGKVKVLVTIFGRETPVELDFLQINKL